MILERVFWTEWSLTLESKRSEGRGNWRGLLACQVRCEVFVYGSFWMKSVMGSVWKMHALNKFTRMSVVWWRRQSVQVENTDKLTDMNILIRIRSFIKAVESGDLHDSMWSSKYALTICDWLWENSPLHAQNDFSVQVFLVYVTWNKKFWRQFFFAKLVSPYLCLHSHQIWKTGSPSKRSSALLEGRHLKLLFHAKNSITRG